MIPSIRHWLRGDFARHALVLGSGTALGQLIMVAVTPLLTRLYTPTDMGLFGLFANFLAVASVAATLRLDFAVATTSSPDSALRLLALSLLICPVASVALSALLYVLIREDVFAYGLLPVWTVPLCAAALIATGCFVALRYWHVGRRDFRVVGRALVAQGFARAGASVLLGLPGTGWVGLALGDLAGRAFGIRRLWREAGTEFARARRSGTLGRLREQLWQARRFPLVVLPSSLVDALAAALPLPLIAWLFGPAAAGQFALVWRVAALPGGLVAASVGDVFHAHAARARDEGPDPSRRLLLDTMRMLGLLAILIYLPLCIVSPWVFGWIFGEPWREAGEMLRLLGPLWVTAMVVSPVSRLPVVLGRPGLKFVFDLCFLVLPMVALVVASSRGLMTALLAYGLATAAAYAVFAVLLYAVAGRRAVQSPPPRTDQDP